MPLFSSTLVATSFPPRSASRTCFACTVELGAISIDSLCVQGCWEEEEAAGAWAGAAGAGEAWLFLLSLTAL